MTIQLTRRERRKRDHDIFVYHETGLPLRTIAELFQLSPHRIHQLVARERRRRLRRQTH